jgi:hypothetical protein
VLFVGLLPATWVFLANRPSSSYSTLCENAREIDRILCYAEMRMLLTSFRTFFAVVANWMKLMIVHSAVLRNIKTEKDQHQNKRAPCGPKGLPGNRDSDSRSFLPSPLQTWKDCHW